MFPKFAIQYFVAHWCTPPAGLEPETLGVNLSVWKATFLPLELGPDYQMHPSGCRMYDISPEQAPGLLDGSINVTTLGTAECHNLNGYDYDQR